MEKKVRNAVRCLVIDDDKVLVTKYIDGVKKGYFDLPGGKIEDGETNVDAAKREVREETGLEVNNLFFKGKIKVEYPDRIYWFDIFITTDFSGETVDNKENIALWTNRKEFMNNHNKEALSNLIILDNMFYNILIDNKEIFIDINVDEKENILSLNYNCM